MRLNTIKWRIFKYNIIAILMLIILTTIIFNIVIRVYFEKDIQWQLSEIANSTEDTALQHGPDFLFDPGNKPPAAPNEQRQGDLLRYYFMLDHTLKESLTVLNANFMLLDRNGKIISPSPENFYDDSTDVLSQITDKINGMGNLKQEEYINLKLSNIQYVAVIKPVFNKNTFGLGWIIIYSSLEKVNQLQIAINMMLFIILIISALIISIFSSHVSKVISTPFIYLNKHIKDIAARNFGDKINIPVDNELQEFVQNINIMSEKLEIYDKAQKTFLQNASHEFRTPLMSIQSYAEGIKYNIVDSDTAVDVIIDETKRMTHLIEDLLYLSRLDTIEENYNFKKLNIEEFVADCAERMNGIADKNNIKISISKFNSKTYVLADEDKLSRAIINIISNCIRYAQSSIIITLRLIESNIILKICDDGPGLNEDELPNIFDRFYKGTKGNFGLGLSISKNIVEKHKGKIIAKNLENGAAFIIELPAIKTMRNCE